MTYEEGCSFMIEKTQAHKETYGPEYKKIKETIKYSSVTIEYPGFKANGDYKVWYQSANMPEAKALTHADIVKNIYYEVTNENYKDFIEFLECLFINGLTCENDFLNYNIRNLIYWLTLQEDLNYPMKNRKQGRKLPFQRYYEAILAKLGHYELSRIIYRTNNHGVDRPSLLHVPVSVKKPVFYDLKKIF